MLRCVCVNVSYMQTCKQIHYERVSAIYFFSRRNKNSKIENFQKINYETVH